MRKRPGSSLCVLLSIGVARGRIVLQLSVRELEAESKASDALWWFENGEVVSYKCNAPMLFTKNVEDEAGEMIGNKRGMEVTDMASARASRKEQLLGKERA